MKTILQTKTLNHSDHVTDKNKQEKCIAVITHYFTLLPASLYAFAASIGRMPQDVLLHSCSKVDISQRISRSRMNKVKCVTRRLSVRPSYKYHVRAHIWPLLLPVSLVFSTG